MPASSDSTDVGGQASIVEIDGDDIKLDGKTIADARPLAADGRFNKVDELFKALVAKREAWSQTNPAKTFAGVAGLRVDPHTSTLVLKDVFQTIALSRYRQITLQIAGSPALYDTAALIPHPPPPPEELSKPGETVVDLRSALGEVEVNWKLNGKVVATRKVDIKELGDAICTQWKADAHAHHDASDPMYDEAVVHVENNAKASDLAPLLSAIDGCHRTRNGVDGTVFVTTLPLN